MTVNVTVIGSGNGGMAVAFDCAQQGHRVSLYSRAEHAHHNLEAVRAKGGITSQGRLEGFAPVAYAGTDVAAAMDGAEIVFVVGPAFATEPFGHDLAPHLRPGMTVVICPGSCGGALAFKRAAGMAVHDDSIIVGETSTLPYACRSDGEGNVHVFHRFDTGLFASAVPRSGNGKFLEILRQIYPSTVEAATVFQTSLQNGNPVIHPAVTLMNAALLERTDGDFLFYEEGVTPVAGRLIEAVDSERLAIAKALGVTILSEPDIGVMQGYMTESNYTTGYSEAPGFRGIKAPTAIDSRYLTEDVGYSLVFFTDLARRLSVPTPTMDAIIQITSVVLGRDLRAEGAGR
ncbi:NAD/NADP-dependent octopine/nopaline dehydrogenase family protein [Amorphoplanes nipponensis]